MRSGGRVLAAVAGLLLAAAPAAAQRVPAGPAPATLEGRFLWDYQSNTPALGALLRFPLFGARGDLTAGGEAVFRHGLTELQAHADALVDLGTLTVGGGPVLLNSVFDPDQPRESRWGYSFVVGLRQLPRPGESIGVSLDVRWIYVGDLKPRFFGIGVGIPLFDMPF